MDYFPCSFHTFYFIFSLCFYFPLFSCNRASDKVRLCFCQTILWFWSLNLLVKLYGKHLCENDKMQKPSEKKHVHTICIFTTDEQKNYIQKCKSNEYKIEKFNGSSFGYSKGCQPYNRWTCGKHFEYFTYSPSMPPNEYAAVFSLKRSPQFNRWLPIHMNGMYQCTTATPPYTFMSHFIRSLYVAFVLEIWRTLKFTAQHSISMCTGTGYGSCLCVSQNFRSFCVAVRWLLFFLIFKYLMRCEWAIRAILLASQQFDTRTNKQIVFLSFGNGMGLNMASGSLIFFSILDVTNAQLVNTILILDAWFNSQCLFCFVLKIPFSKVAISNGNANRFAWNWSS